MDIIPQGDKAPLPAISMSCIIALSSISDWMCGTLVTQTARRFSSILFTPDYFVELLFWVEDKRFAVHFGMDPIAVVRAIAFNLRRGTALQGASTIAQQVYTIRLTRSCRVYRSFPYKVKQASWSLYASAVRSKASILDEYVNTVYWGRSYHGLDNAAKGYFNATRASLSIAQSFFLAERLAAPNRVSVPRISNLLKRAPIKLALLRNGARFNDIIDLYERIYGCGGEMWRLLGK
jgi:membrane peptidoglycan carboxypeptidase